MARIKYYYDTETCKYERIKVSFWDVVLNLAGFLIAAFVFAAVLVWVLSTWFQSRREVSLIKENEELRYKYEVLQKEMQLTQDMLVELQKKDDNIYRLIFEAEPYPTSIRSPKINTLASYNMDRDQLVFTVEKKIEDLQRQMYIQTKSYDEIIQMAKDKSRMLSSIPAIQPVENKDLTRLVSGFGWRIHPILKVKKRHDGVDFAAPKGTPIYAAGDGIIQRARDNRGGYGKMIVIDHGFGYNTRYAHMSKFEVKRGDKVKRGELIGYVGSTGMSTAPHLHFEVEYNGKKVNPVHYFTEKLTPEQYQKILELSSVENQMLD